MNGPHRVVLITTDRVICVPIDNSYEEGIAYVPSAHESVPYYADGNMPPVIPSEPTYEPEPLEPDEDADADKDCPNG